MASFDHQQRTRIVFGPGTVDRVGELAAETGGHRVLLVTDPHIVEAGHADRVRGALDASGLKVVTYDRVRENPTTRDVGACLEVARSDDVDVIVGLGGGSSIDTAKGCNFLLTNGGRMADYWGVGKAAHAMLPLIAVPTTAGTGSECQSFALIADEQTHQKMACGDTKAAPCTALLDPALTVTQPRHVAACTGIDAVAHALETAVTNVRNPLSLLYSHEAFRLAQAALPRVLAPPDDLEARGRMQLGAAFAGIAIENSMLGAAHAAANPLTARFGVVHGEAVGLMLPHVVRYNADADDVRGGYAALAQRSGLHDPSDDDEQRAVESLLTRLESLLDEARLTRCLAQCDVPRSAIGDLAEEAAGQWTARFNPRPVAAEDFAGLYERAFEPVRPSRVVSERRNAL